MEIESGKPAASQDEPKAVEGLKGTRLSTLMMLVLWAGAIVFRTIGMDWTTIECGQDFDDDDTDELCVRYSAIYR